MSAKPHARPRRQRSTGTIMAAVIVGVPALIFWILIGAWLSSTSFAWLAALWFGVPVLFIGSAAVSGVRRPRRR